MSNLSWAALLAASTLCACVDQGPDELGSTTDAIVEGSPNAYGILRLLNAPATTVPLLDDAVGLDKRAATNLIAHRDGGDPFDSIAEVDAVGYVGAAAIERLRAYAAAHGFIPTGGDLLGVFDNVAFTVDEAHATLALVNDVEASVLDIKVGLDRRAVAAIIPARRIKSLLLLAQIPYVGQSAMLKLREYPRTSGGTKAVGEDCAAHAECASGLCAGIQVPFSDGTGWCKPAWMANTFTSTTPLQIADTGMPVTSTIVVSGLATVPLDVLIDLEIAHPRPQDLVVVLHQPSSATAVLWNHAANPPSHIVTPSGLESDSSVNGEWVLEITDTVTGQTGTLTKWSMWISSNYD